MRCGAMRIAWGYRKFAAFAATPLQYASAGDSPPTWLKLFSYRVTFAHCNCDWRQLRTEVAKGLGNTGLNNAETYLLITILVQIWLIEFSDNGS